MAKNVRLNNLSTVKKTSAYATLCELRATLLTPSALFRLKTPQESILQYIYYIIAFMSKSESLNQKALMLPYVQDSLLRMLRPRCYQALHSRSLVRA